MRKKKGDVRVGGGRKDLADRGENEDTNILPRISCSIENGSGANERVQTFHLPGAVAELEARDAVRGRVVAEALGQHLQ